MKEFPRIALIPGPQDRVTFEVGGGGRLTYYHGGDLPRPYLYPVIGPAGRGVTRIEHPHDPFGHRHHRSVWTGHHDVNQSSWWAEGANRIRSERVVELADGSVGRLVADHRWVDARGQGLLRERWSVTYHELEGDESLIEIHLRYQCQDQQVTFGKTPFGFLGLRVAKTVSVADGDGRILNSEGAVNEKQVLWKRARWVDYSGTVWPGRINGVTLMDGSENPRHPTYWHVRNDGWVGASFCYDAPFVLERGKTLDLRYGLYVHDGVGAPERIEKQYEWWSGRP